MDNGYFDGRCAWIFLSKYRLYKYNQFIKHVYRSIGVFVFFIKTSVQAWRILNVGKEYSIKSSGER